MRRKWRIAGKWLPEQHHSTPFDSLSRFAEGEEEEPSAVRAAVRAADGSRRGETALGIGSGQLQRRGCEAARVVCGVEENKLLRSRHRV